MDTSNSHRVLIVEDDVEVRAALSQLFASNRYEVGLASNGAEAIELLEQNLEPCAVVIDLLMPGIVGHEVLDYMRDDQRLAAIPVAIISGSPELAPPGYQVFPKPIDGGALVRFVGSGCCRDHKLSV